MPRTGRATTRIALTVLVIAASLPSAKAWAADQEEEGFHFGSYGRIRAATDLRGGGPQYSSFVTHGSRLDLPPYLELELRNTQYPEEGMRLRVISTMGIAGDPFHYTGRWEAKTAIRNMFVDVQGLWHEGLTIWAGAKMYRGDDIYLLDFWPLDNLNTVGGGASIDLPTGTRVQAHVGISRLLDGAFQYQERLVPSRSAFGATQSVTLDRPRTIASSKITQYVPGFTATQGYKFSLHAEGHFLPSGIYEPATDRVMPSKYLPSDTGFVLGAQGTAYGLGDKDGFGHLFVRYAKGIAAYGDLSIPYGVPNEKKSNASELLIALAGNYQYDRYALMAAAYARRFSDANAGATSRNKFWEGILVARPIVYTSAHTGVSVEVSYQAKNPNWLDDSGKHRVPQAWRFSAIPFVTPFGWGSYTRPVIQLVYTATVRNQAARLLYPVEDPRSERKIEHYLGLTAEWWFNSTSYP